MIFFPYRPQIELTKVPVVTILISLLCLGVYIEQYRNDLAIQAQAEAFCTPKVAAEFEVLAKYPCEFLLTDIYMNPWDRDYLPEVLYEITQPYDDIIWERYQEFKVAAPSYLTPKLVYDRTSWHPGKMLISSVAHADWEHLIFNLFFFIAFAVTVELIIGPILFVVVCVALSLGIGSIDTLMHLGQSDVPPTLGLSGVVMGMLGLFAYLAPKVNIRFFYWVFISVGTVGVPAWFVALWYIGWDMHDQLYEVGSRTNFIAHLAGAALGFAIGLAVFRKKRHWVQALVVEHVDFTKEEPLHRKVAFFIGLPAFLVVFLLVLDRAITFLGWFVISFWVPLLFVVPIGAAIWQLRTGSDVGRYRKGMELLNLREYKKAIESLQPLAEKGHAGAQFALGNIYATPMMKHVSNTLHWYGQAAKRGHAEAQYALGQRSDDPAKAMEWYRKAAERGLADAAYSLGFCYEKGKGAEADKDEAANWYHRAGQLFLKARRLEDVEMAIASLNGLTPDHPLGAKLRGLMA